MLTSWPVDPVVWLSLIAAAAAYQRLFRRVPRYPSVRRTHFYVGLAAMAVALASPMAVYAHSLFWVHMAQHLMLTMVAAPLLMLGAPVTLGLRAASPPVRARLSRVLHSPVLRALTHPAVSWGVFGAVMWVSHFSPVYEQALTSEIAHVGEHLAYLLAGCLFWWPVVGLDPTSRRIGWPGRVGYVVLAMPQQSFLGLAIYSADQPLYSHYARLHPTLGSALSDQRVAGMVMWLGGDLLFIVALGLSVAAWMRHDIKEANRMDSRLTGAG